jgi:hypothetical protein
VRLCAVKVYRAKNVNKVLFKKILIIEHQFFTEFSSNIKGNAGFNQNKTVGQLFITP